MTAARRRDDGLTLVELIITMAISSVVLLIIGGLFVSTVLAERTVRDASLTATQVQSAVRGISDGVGNASHLQLTNPTGSDQLLVVRSAGNGATASWGCEAWYFDAAKGIVRRSTSAPGAPIVAPDSTQLATWPVVMTGIAPTSGSGIFVLTGNEVDIGFTARTQDQVVRIVTTVARPGYIPVAPGEGDRCF